MRIATSCLALLVLCGAVSARPQDKAKKPELSNTIDRILEGRWSSMKPGPAPVCDDYEFLRRVSLDLRGFPPGAEEVRAFVANESQAKRLEKIDEYIASDDYATHFGDWLAQVLMYDNYNDLYIQPGKNFNYKTKRRMEKDFLKYIKEQVGKDVPMAQLLRELLEATGKSEENPLILYKLSMWDGEPQHLEFADKVSKSWLGIRVSCARCHDHPFDRWTQEDFYGLAGFFVRHKLKLNGGAKENECDEVEMTEKADAQELTMPETGKVLKPKFLYGETCSKMDPHMTALAVFMSKREHNQLARNFSNRMWATLMGRGIVHPVDDFNQKNRPTIPELLENLTKEFAANRWSLKFMARAICASKSYQRASAREATGDVKDYARAAIRELTSEQLFLSIVMATRGPEMLAKRSGDTMKGGWDYFAGQMNLVYGPGIAWTEVSYLPGNARQMLMIRNSDYIQGMIRDGIASRSCQMEGKLADKVESMFLSILCRPPTEAERDRWAQWLEKHNDREGFQDVCWTLINSTEFVTRH